MRFQVLMATMNRKKEEITQLIQTTNLACDILLINQCDRVDNYELNVNDHVVNVYEMNEKGLSKSRNAALSKTDADICLIADDDILYDDNLVNKIHMAFTNNPNYDIIAFYVARSANFRQMEKGNQHRIGKLKSLSIMSVQIAFRRKSLLDKNISFDEKFGAGSGVFICGEENIFLMDCINAGCKILYVPEEIARTEDTESSWFQGFNDIYFMSKGAVFYRLFSLFSIPLVWAFAVTKRNMYKKDMSMRKALKYMNLGRKEYKRMIK